MVAGIYNLLNIYMWMWVDRVDVGWGVFIFLYMLYIIKCYVIYVFVVGCSCVVWIIAAIEQELEHQRDGVRFSVVVWGVDGFGWKVMMKVVGWCCCNCCNVMPKVMYDYE